VATVGTVINNTYRKTVDRGIASLGSSNTPIGISLNPSDVVSSIGSLARGSPVRGILVEAYVTAWRKGCFCLIGVAGVQLVLCAVMRRVEFDSTRRREKS